VKTTCTHCEKELPTPHFVFNHPYCNKHCFHDHMSLISDRNILRRFLKEGVTDLNEKQLRSIIRLKLISYDHKKKKYCLTPRSQGILEMTMLGVS